MTSPYHCVSLAPGDGKKRDPENEVGLTYNLVRRVSFLPAPYSKRETLVGDGHVSTIIWDITNTTCILLEEGTAE